jgi:hypothetical protein
MRLTMKERKAVTAVMRARYGRASKKQKGGLLDELVALAGYNRWYAVGLLRGAGTWSRGRQRPMARPRQRWRVYDGTVPVQQGASARLRSPMETPDDQTPGS